MMSDETEVRKALDKWQNLYGGTERFQPSANNPSIGAVAIRANDFRPDRGNWPKIFYHSRRTARTLVLVHGLTDSPCYVEAIALRFAAHGYNVVLPLLPGHGRKTPGPAMAESDHHQWRRTVDAAVEVAHLMGDELSIGGFSTGGALSTDKALRDPESIDGKLFLFSAALDLSDLEKLFLGTHVVGAIEEIKEGKTGNDGIGGDPCKYSRMFMEGAEELEKLIKDLRSAASDQKSGEDFANLRHKDRVFVAHSEADETIDYTAMMPLVRPGETNQHHIVAKSMKVGHSELVLDTDRVHTGQRHPDECDPPRANPEFGKMMDKALAYADAGR